MVTLPALLLVVILTAAMWHFVITKYDMPWWAGMLMIGALAISYGTILSRLIH